MSSLNIKLTEELRSYVDSRASESDVYATPSEYIRDLIRHDMENQEIENRVLRGLDDLKNDRIVYHSVLDLKRPES